MEIKERISECTYRRKTLKELRESGIALSKEVTDIIFKNPFIADLEETAELCGLYSAFIIGDSGVYFVYGYDQRTIHVGHFIEFNNAVYPASYIKKHGPYPLGYYTGIGWNSAKITGNMYDILELNKKMKILELMANRYKASGFDVLPEAFLWVDTSDRELYRDFQNVLENRSIVETIGKEKWRQYEHLCLDAIAAWEFPISPNNYKKCGSLAFSGSRYDIYRDNGNDEIYNDTAKWYDHFKKSPEVYYIRIDSADEIKYIEKRLDELDVPYFDTSDKDWIKNTGNGARKLNTQHNLLNEKIHKVIDQEAKKSEFVDRICVSKLDHDVLSYLHYEYMLTKFTKEELDLGDELYRRSLDARKRKDPDACFAAYLFNIPDLYLDEFKKFARENDIRWGHPRTPDLNRYDTSNVITLIVEAFDMPITERFVQTVYDKIMCMHEISYKHDAPWELRTPCKPSKDYSSVNSLSEPWHFDVPGAKFKMMNLDGKSAYFPLSLMHGQNWVNPISLYDEEGLHVDNAKAFNNSQLSVEEAKEIIKEFEDRNSKI